MNTQNALKLIAASAMVAAGTAFAHEGHAMTGAHWHATDVWGLVALGGMMVLAIWLSSNDK